MEQNKTGKYFKYAIGEIVLVVIGILIALSINNWNEERKENIKEYAVIKNLIQDLKSDSASYSVNYKTLKDIKSLHSKLYEIGINGEDNIIIEKPSYIRRTLYYNPITIENDPFVSSKISSDEVRKEVMNYFRYAKKMDDSYREFEDVVQNRIRIFLGQNKIHNISGWFNNQNTETPNLINEEDLVSLSNLPEFQQLLLEASLKLQEVIEALEALIDQSNRLKDILKEELKHK